MNKLTFFVFCLFNSAVFAQSPAKQIEERRFKAEDSRTVAEILVARVHDRENEDQERPDLELLRNSEAERKFLDSIGLNYSTELRRARSLAERGPFSFEQSAVVRMYLPEKAVVSAMKSGFLNQHQTGQKGVLMGPGGEERAYWDRLHLRYPIESRYDARTNNPAHFIRPKSAILDVSQVRANINGRQTRFVSQSAADIYGEVIVVFKKDVLKRVIWSVGVSDGNNESFTIKRKMYDLFIQANFLEAMVFGELDLRDVQEFWIQEHASSQTVDALIRSGLPVYHYRSVNKPYKGNFDIRDTKPLFSGNPELIAALAKPPVGLWEDYLRRNSNILLGAKIKSQEDRTQSRSERRSTKTITCEGLFNGVSR